MPVSMTGFAGRASKRKRTNTAMKQAIFKVLEPSHKEKYGRLGLLRLPVKGMTIHSGFSTQLTMQHISVKHPNEQTILVNERTVLFHDSCILHKLCSYGKKCYPGCRRFSEIDLINLRGTGVTKICTVESCIRSPRDSQKQNFPVSGSTRLILSGYLLT